MMRLLRFSLVYSALVFGAGFILGPIRVLWLVPRVGERVAELIESPIMLVVIIVAGRWVTRRLGAATTSLDCVIVGSIALALLLSCEFTVVLWLRGSSVADYMSNRDPVAGTVYVVLLALFAGMPLAAKRISRIRAKD